MLELTTERLLLWDFGADDLQSVHADASDAEVCSYTDRGPNTLAQSSLTRWSPPPWSSSAAPFTWIPRKGGVMPAPRKYPDEPRERSLSLNAALNRIGPLIT